MVPQLVKHRVSGFSFTPLPGFFSPFLHSTMRYRSLRVFSLTGWSRLFPTRFHVSRGTLDPAACNQISRTGLSPSLFGFPKTILLSSYNDVCSRTPDCTQSGLGSFPFARRYLEITVVFSSSGYLDVSVHRVPSMAMYSPYSDRSFSCRVSPFRNLRVNGYLLLTAAYRSLSRLSSALSAKASTLRSYSPDLLFQCISDNTPARFLRDECMITK